MEQKPIVHEGYDDWTPAFCGNYKEGDHFSPHQELTTCEECKTARPKESI